MENSAPLAERSVIVVLGMDRSGTSLCTEILHLLGMELSEDLIGPDPHNAKGYFESNAVYECNEKLLLALNSHWDEIRSLRPLSAAWWRLPAARETEQKLTDLVRSRLSKPSGVWGFKDPRTAGLLPLWRRVFRNCRVSPIYVLSVRHPAAVAASLDRRHGISRRASELLWLERYYQACSILGSQIRCVVHYEDWFSNPLEQARRLLDATGLAWPSSEPELEETLRVAADASLAHQKSSDRVEIQAVRDLYNYFREYTAVPPTKFLHRFEFAIGLSRDYAAVAAELQRRPLIGATSLVNREAELAQLQVPAETPAAAEGPTESVEVEPQAPAVEVAVPPAEAPLTIEPNEPVTVLSEEQPEFGFEEAVSGEAVAAGEAYVSSPPVDAATGGAGSPEFAVAVDIQSDDSPMAEHVHSNGFG